MTNMNFSGCRKGTMFCGFFVKRKGGKKKSQGRMYLPPDDPGTLNVHAGMLAAPEDRDLQKSIPVCFKEKLVNSDIPYPEQERAQRIKRK